MIGASSVHLSDAATRQMVLRAAVLPQAGGPSVLEHLERSVGPAGFQFAPGNWPSAKIPQSFSSSLGDIP